MKKLASILLAMVLLLACIPMGTVSAAASNADIIFDFLKSEMGLNSAAACGILANIERESSFRPDIFGDNGSGYGLCQWNRTRFAALKTWCDANGYDYTTLTGQLQYLKFELSADDSNYLWNGKTIYDKMASVSNSMEGAYEAGYHWCYYYEVPANRATRSVERGSLAAMKYWSAYGDNVVAPANQLMAGCINYPIYMQPGQAFQVFGTISSPNELEHVQCYVEDAAGDMMFWDGYGYAEDEQEQKVTTFDVNDLDANMLFSDLPIGSYTYVVEAVDSHGYCVLVKKPFTVALLTEASSIVTEVSTHDHTRNPDYTWGAWVTTEKATCAQTGEQMRTCYCGAIETETLAKSNHSYQSATCTKAKTCKVCGKTSGKAKGHDYKTITKKVATKSANGYTVKQCKVCKKETDKKTIYKASSLKLSTTSYTYNGKAKKPSVTIKDSKGNKISSSYYTVSYPSGRTKVGSYKVKIKFKGKYSGTEYLTFKINPAKTSVDSLTAGSKSLKVKIDKKSTQVTGYQIEYSTSKSFSSKYTKSKTISSYKTTSVTLKSLKAKKTYYVRVRTYKVVDGKKYYSAWSSVKYKKTK